MNRLPLAFVLLLLSLAFAALAWWAARLRLSYVRWYREPEPITYAGGGA